MLLNIEIEIVWLLLIASAVAMAVRRVRIPYTVALVIVGAVVGLFGVLPDLHLTPEVVFDIFLPILLFEAAFHLQYRELRLNAVPVLVLAVPGLLLSALVTGGGLHLLAGPAGLPGISLPVALLFGAMISATDPISVIAVFRELGVNRRLAQIVEGESLFNDGTAVVVFGILLEMIRGGEVGLRAGFATFVVVVVGGAAVGLALGLIFSRLTALIDDHLIEITLTTILAFAAYLGAEMVHCSGVISVVMAGLMVGNYGTRTGMSPTTRVSVGDFWEYAAFVVNSAIFLLIGLEVMAGSFVDFLGGVVAAVGATFLGRAVGVAASAAVINRFAAPLSPRWQGVMVWGGLRGSLSMALALTLPADFPARQALLAMVFGVVAFSLVVQGLSMKPLLRRLGLGGENTGQRDFEERRGRLLALTAAGEEIRSLERRGVVSHGTTATLGREFDGRVLAARAAVTESYEADAAIRERELALARAHLIDAGEEAVKSACRDGIIGEKTLKALLDEMAREREEGPGASHQPPRIST